MSTSQAAILVMEPELMFAAANESSDQHPLARRLLDYREYDLISVVLVSSEPPQQIASKLNDAGFQYASLIFDPTKVTMHSFQHDGWQPHAFTSNDAADALKQWLSQNFPSTSSVVLSVSSPTTRKLAGEFYSIASSVLKQAELITLHRQHQSSDSTHKLFFADEDGLKGVFSGLHWFDALPKGAVENARSTESRLGAFSIKQDEASVAVRTWATSVDVVVNRNGWKRTVTMKRTEDRTFVARIKQFQPGDHYAFALNGNHEKLYPDPRSRSQPDGVHGFSELIGPSVFPWADEGWQGISKEDLIIYELHIGTFTQSGTFRSTLERLPELVELGVTAIELLPIVESAGRWNWGYDGVNLFAPYHPYGNADDLKQLVDECHRLGLAVILDVVYNHPGPEGNYLAEFGPYFSKQHHTPWGPAYNFDGRNRRLCREWVLDNVEYWLDEFHFDGLRFDAIHFMFDNSQPSIVQEIAQRVRQLGDARDKYYLLIGETNVFDASMIAPTSEGGMDFDAIWCDDMMHSIYSVGSPETRLTNRSYRQHADIVESLRHGFLYHGPDALRINRDDENQIESGPVASTVVALQTHDSVGNQPLGERLHRLTNADFHRSAVALSLLYPAIPMLFMGDETLEPNPFHYFVDFHDPWLRDAIAKSRRNEHPQQDWKKTLSPLSETAFTESKLSPIDSADLDEQRIMTRDWYRQLISIRKRWVSWDLLTADRLRVNYILEWHVFQLSYESEQTAVQIIVRLTNPSDVEPRPVSIEVEGKVVADSLPRNVTPEAAASQLSLRANHAIVVEGHVKFPA